ncbi:DUF1697 domain-containing protein [Skermania piniformis]|nr:DUF1697 domain-containing protein [Skermania piniformis]
MADLRDTLTAAGLADVRTVLASGNAVFASSDIDRTELKARIEEALRDTFGYPAWIVLRDLDQVRAIVDGYPFPERDERQPYVLLAADPASLAELAEAAPELDPAVEQIRLGDDVLYWEVLRGRTLTSAFGKASANRKYKSTVTNRNLRTLRKILA